MAHGAYGSQTWAWWHSSHAETLRGEGAKVRAQGAEVLREATAAHHEAELTWLQVEQEVASERYAVGEA